MTLSRSIVSRWPRPLVTSCASLYCRGPHPTHTCFSPGEVAMRRVPALVRSLPIVAVLSVAPHAYAQQVSVAPPAALDSLRPRIRHLLDSLHGPSLALAAA